MLLIGLGLAAVAIWVLVRLGKQTEKARRGHWRISATLLGGTCFAGAVLCVAKGSYILAAALAAAGLYLVMQSRIRSVASPKPAASTGPLMSKAEARAILGVRENASRDDIQTAWKRLMARTHPDQGGSEGLAARVNAARDRLLG
ncbi:molecular chaperone DnaJ [Brevundimonas terrae]|uniref:Molecular chaperone DnaJ n=1 Tax=Brevundimonas terrae TaxID=363631 RepID=A0ABN0YET1_9CAUL|nr:molecular chaperone DnaJ [Brevundimonas terrae]NIJ26708.1 DnaJ-domain-containing protein 1 [Brevundimonas terrae]